MCRGGINGDNLFVASAFEPERKVKDEDIKPEQDDMLDVSRRARLQGAENLLRLSPGTADGGDE